MPEFLYELMKKLRVKMESGGCQGHTLEVNELGFGHVRVKQIEHRELNKEPYGFLK